MPNQPGTGALIGGVTGAARGNAIGDDTRSTIIGGVAEAMIGGAIGENMARQERELNQQLAGTGARITNTGNQLLVILPENVTFPTGSSKVNSSFLPALRELARSLRAYPSSVIRVVGHTDIVGSEAYNMELSRARARRCPHPDRLWCLGQPSHLFRARLQRADRIEQLGGRPGDESPGRSGDHADELTGPPPSTA